MCADDVDLSEVAAGQERFFLILFSFDEDISIRIADEGLSPKLKRVFMPNAVDGRDEYAVRNGMATHHRFPGGTLTLSIFVLLRRDPTDRRRIEEDLSSAQRRQPRGFGKPLVPTDTNAQVTLRGWD